MKGTTLGYMPSAYVNDLITFLDSCPTSYHAAQRCADGLAACGYACLAETELWTELPARGYVKRDGAILAWVAPVQQVPDAGLRIYGAHTDSPALKVKPGGEYVSAGFAMTNVEVYGGALLHTWFDRELRLAGRLVDAQGDVHLVASGPVAWVPSLAIHLDHSVNESFQIDRQRDLMPVYGLGDASISAYAAGLAGLDEQEVLAADLFLVAAQVPELIGVNQELLVGPRMDNLLSTHAGLAAMRTAQASDAWQIFVAFDHEEIGSGTASGACDSLLADVLGRIARLSGLDADGCAAWLARAVCVSADVAHAVHPNKTDHYDPCARALIDGGPVIKWSAPMRYATDATSTAVFVRACQRAGVNHQVFVNHNNIPGGSTIGALLATRLGIRTVDVGIPIMGMHSIREICASGATQEFSRVISAFLAG